MPSDYGDKQYWDERYSKSNDLFDWLQKYETLKPILEEVFLQISKDSPILHVGCGNSEFGYV